MSKTEFSPTERSSTTMDKDTLICKLHQRIQLLSSFLTPYLPLANSVTIDFFVSDLWKQFIPTHIGEEILQLPEEQRLTFASYPVLNSPFLVNGSIHNISERSAMNNDINDSVVVVDEPTLPHWQHSSLAALLNDARDHLADCLGPDIVTSLDMLNASLDCDIGQEVDSIPYMISPKKRHEVDVMAHLCAKLARSQQISSVSEIMLLKMW